MRGIQIESPAKFILDELHLLYEWVYLFSIYELLLSYKEAYVNMVTI